MARKKKKVTKALARSLSWLVLSWQVKVVGSIPSQGTYKKQPINAHISGTTNRCFSQINFKNVWQRLNSPEGGEVGTGTLDGSESNRVIRVFASPHGCLKDIKLPLELRTGWRQENESWQPALMVWPEEEHGWLRRTSCTWIRSEL